MRILGLDLATNVGFACGSLREGIIEHGEYRLPSTGENVGLFLIHFRKWLNATITRLEPREIAFEQPILPGIGKTTLNTLRKLYGLAGMTEVIAEDCSLACGEVNLRDARSHALGKGNVPRDGDTAKRAVMMWCRNRGLNPIGTDASDALAVLDFVLSTKKPSHALKATPLFREIPI